MESLLGAEDPETLRAKRAMASLLEKLGDYAGAEALLREVRRRRTAEESSGAVLILSAPFLAVYLYL